MLGFNDAEFDIRLDLSTIKLGMTFTTKSIGYNICLARMVANLAVVVV
jgi:hypothetical protein